MRTAKIFSATGAVVLFTVCCRGESAQTAKPQVLDWTNHLVLSVKQQELLHIYTGLDDANTRPEKRGKLAVDAKRISEQLGAATVRHAKADELIVTRDQSGVVTIFNPSEENVAFTVSVRGDEQRMGTGMASIGRLTFLPPKGTLRVPNIYWTTPSMTHKN